MTWKYKDLVIWYVDGVDLISFLFTICFSRYFSVSELWVIILCISSLRTQEKFLTFFAGEGGE